MREGYCGTWSMSERELALNELIQQARQSWHGVKLGNPDWCDDSHSLALYAEVPEGRAGRLRDQ